MHKNIKKVIRYSLISSSLFSALAQADIYYSEKVAGPIVNVFSVNKQGIKKNITNNTQVRDLDHHVSSSGLISFSSNRKDNYKPSNYKAPRQAENYNIFILDPYSQKLTQVTSETTQEQLPRFSPSGNELAFIRSNKKQQDLVIYDLKSKQQRVINSAKYIFDYAWSPDGTKIAVSTQNTNNASLLIVDLQTLHKQVLVEDSVNKQQKTLSYIFDAPSWSPDGEYLAYINHPLKTGKNRELYVYHLKSTQNQLISDKAIQVQSPINWSKDNKRLLYSALVNYQQYYDQQIHQKVYLGGMHIFSSDLSGNSKKMTQGDHLFKHPIYSPDESSIAFLYADKLNARTLQLKTMKLDGSEQKTLSESVFKSAKLQWQ